jgi:PAS domain S-box-containing protein
MDGVETAKEVRDLHGIPVVFLSAYSDSETLQRAKLIEPFGYLIKPYKVRELFTTLEITFYKHRMEKLIRDNERHLKTLLRSIGDGVITIGTEGQITSMNPVAEKLTGWNESESKQENVLDILQLEETGVKTLLPDLIAKTLVGETVSCLVEDELILVNREGKKIAVDLSAAPIRNDDEKIVGSVFTVRDISSRKQAEIDLSEARQVLRNSLTPREKEVLQLMVKGFRTKEIAFDLNISTRTVEAHRKNMMSKLNVGDMTMLVSFAVTHKLVPL